MRWFILLTIISLVALASTKPVSSPSDEEESASPWMTKNTNDNFFLNTYFGMTVEKPEEWFSVSTDELNSIVTKFAKSLINNVNDPSDRSEGKMIPLFGFTAVPTGAQNGQTNANILALAEKTTGKENLDDDCDIIRAAESVQLTDMKNIHRSQCRLIDINNINYAVQESTWNMQNTTIIKQIQFLRSTENGYVISFTLTYANEKDKKILVRCMNTVFFT